MARIGALGTWRRAQGLTPVVRANGTGADVTGYSGHCNAVATFFFFLEGRPGGSESGVVPTCSITCDCLPISLSAAAGFVNPAKDSLWNHMPRLLFLSAGPSASISSPVDSAVAKNNRKCQDRKICLIIPSSAACPPDDLGWEIIRIFIPGVPSARGVTLKNGPYRAEH